jgi:hypothetical protein
MKFVKGFIVSLIVYFGLSILFYGLKVMNAGNDFADIFSVASDNMQFASLLYYYVASPTFMTVFQSVILFANSPTAWGAWIEILGSIVPIAVAALLGSLAERKSGSTKYIFFSTYIGLLVIAFIGIAIQAAFWPTAGLSLSANYYLHWEWFVPSALIMTSINAFVWCAIGLFITNKGWG